MNEPSKPLLILRENVSSLARMLRKSFDIELFADGRATCTEVSNAPKGTMSLLTWTGSLAERLRAFVEALSRGQFESWPAVVGAGPHAIELTVRDADGREQRRIARVSFENGQVMTDAESERYGVLELVGLVDDMVEALRGGASQRGAESAEKGFPSIEDRRARRRSLRFTETHDWDGSTAWNRLLDARLSSNGQGERREVDIANRGYRVTQRKGFTVSEGECSAMFDSIDAMNLRAVRRSAGGGALDTTYTQTVAYFDGTRVIEFEYVWTRERGLGVSDGGDPPNATERALLDLAASLARR